MKKIGENSFNNGSKLTSVVIPDTVTHIESLAFVSNNLRKVIFGKNVTNIDYMAFSENRIFRLELPDSLIYI